MSTFTCTCGHEVSVRCYMADGAVETETRCTTCGRSAYDYNGYHDSKPTPTVDQMAEEHNASDINRGLAIIEKFDAWFASAGTA